MKSPIVRILATAISVLLLGGQASAAEKTLAASTSGPSSTETRTAHRSTYPFRGEVESADASSIVLAKKDGTRKVEVSSDSLIERDGKPIAATEVKPGDYVRGLVRKNDAGSEVLVKASAGAKPEKGTSRKAKKSA
jgi:hypothetical protein